MKGIEYSILKARIKDMANDGVIYRVASGIYALSLLEVSPERLIREKYLCRNGKTIGVYYRESIAYEYGLINEKPDIVSIQTNKESGLKGRLVNAFGQTIRLMGCRFKINDMTKEIAEALNILSCSLMKICSGEISKAEAIKHIHGHALTYDMFLPYISTQNKTLQRWVKEIFNIEPK
ncbi:MAG: hypothetical protein LIO92_07450 [Clostridiales bacterium]|nr:hypothetical protein [Clostridiales bacterium]